MARTTAAANANQNYQNQSIGAYNNAQTDIGQYTGNVNKLSSGTNVGANPFQSAAYLSNVNKLQSEGLNTAADSAKATMARTLRATGGLNGSQTALAQRDVGLQTGRLADTLSAERSSQDYGKNLQWQQYLAGAPLAAAGAEGSLFGTATGGQMGSLNALNAANGQYTSLLNTLITNGKQAASAPAGGGE